MAKKWQQKEIAALKGSAAKLTIHELADRFGTDTASVEEKLGELGLEARKGFEKAWYDDPQVARYEAAVKLVQNGSWKKAHQELSELVPEVDVPEVVARARQMLKICEVQLQEGADAAQDPFLEAVYLKNRGRLEEALAICSVGGRQAKEDRFAYLAASVHALSERADEAVAALRKAVELNPKNRVYAYHDPDFEPILGQPELQELFGAS
jgi:tetratricopeptide (TPR) repeat protein